MFVRTVWMPTKWPIRITVLDNNGEKRKWSNTSNNNAITTAAERGYKQDIAGPCCHAGNGYIHSSLSTGYLPSV